jgi:hypothetical protein
MLLSQRSKLPKQAAPVQRPSTSTMRFSQTGGVEASGVIEILEDLLAKKV